LHIADERVHRVPSLPTPESANGVQPSPDALMRFEAVQLFVNRASSAHTNFALQAANTRAVAQICRRLDGIPLALELAAARVKVMPVEALAQRLDSRFKLLTSGNAEALPRHRTLQALIAWSYDLLSPTEQALLRQLSVFVGGWTLEAAEAVCNLGDASVLDHLIALVDHSLVVFGNDPQQQRYTMLETIRQFAQEQLRLNSEETKANARHAGHFAQFVSQASAQAHRPTHQRALDQVDGERDNVLGALSWAIAHEADLALHLEMSLGGEFNFWEMRGHFEEGRHWLRQLLAATETNVSIARAKVLLDAVRVERALPDYAQALAYAHASQTLSDALGDAFCSNDARRRIADIMALQGDFAGSSAMLRTCLAEAERLEYERGIENALFALANNHLDLHENEAAGLLFERCLIMARERGDALNVADALHHLALITDAKGDPAGSIPMYEEVEATYRAMGYRRSMALVQNNLGYALIRLGDYARARRLFVEGLLIRREMGLRLGYVYSFVNFGVLAALEDKPARAAHLLGAAEALSDQIGFSHTTVEDDLYLAAIASMQAALGETRFKLEWSRGRGMTIEQAIELALHEPT
jgi:non-specific serine/threonine protein kinase